ncbi:hypothetical protein SAMN05421736_109116 [Evansella caseinilytica]|uniref:DUF7689 domain-containing protein n=1 Tax=Evansella caseinilytica TaxID=1503961 RepID=A0A1H3RYX0_9BACI|nr:hypothetical protein [Evansella caseinilytica]SDZ30465.1 hypothetical protein SAMN05421736_109116 [Evansella caseinilytica]
MALLIVLAVFAGSSTATLAGMTTPKETINKGLEVSGNYKWVADATDKYNCLANALGDRSKWIWPWGSKKPTSSKVNNYLADKGYKYSQPMDSQNVAVYEIISYGASSGIKHFGRIVSQKTRAKWGQLELLEHNGWDLYSSAYYGNAVRKYAVK